MKANSVSDILLESVKSVMFGEPLDDWGTYVCFGKEEFKNSHCGSCESDNEYSSVIEDLCCSHRELALKVAKLIQSKQLEAEIKTHDFYWHRQSYVAKNGIGSLSLEMKQESEKELADLLTDQTSKL